MSKTPLRPPQKRNDEYTQSGGEYGIVIDGNTIRRDVEILEVKNAIYACPKPEKQKRKPRPAKLPTRYEILEQQVEDTIKLIICWRDSQECVMKDIDGGRCGNGLMWNHYIAQKQSHWMKYDLGNAYWGCGNHNLLDKNGDPTLKIWVQKTFGTSVVLALQAEARAHSGNKLQRTEQDLEALRAHYDQLYQDRFFVGTDIPSRIKAGYYGKIIKGAWVAEDDDEQIFNLRGKPIATGVITWTKT